MSAAPLQCAEHPAETVVSTCSRCGRFVCHQCVVDVDGPLRCSHCQLRTAPPPSLALDLATIRIALEPMVHMSAVFASLVALHSRSFAVLPFALLEAVAAATSTRTWWLFVRRRPRALQAVVWQQVTTLAIAAGDGVLAYEKFGPFPLGVIVLAALIHAAMAGPLISFVQTSPVAAEEFARWP